MFGNYCFKVPTLNFSNIESISMPLSFSVRAEMTPKVFAKWLLVCKRYHFWAQWDDTQPTLINYGNCLVLPSPLKGDQHTSDTFGLVDWQIPLHPGGQIVTHPNVYLYCCCDTAKHLILTLAKSLLLYSIVCAAYATFVYYGGRRNKNNLLHLISPFMH